MPESRSSTSALAIAGILAVTLIVCTLLLTAAFVRTHSSDETIRVIGSARKPIRSDFIIWSGTVTETGAKVAPAYASLKRDMSQVRAYLVAKGIQDGEIVLSAITTKTLYAPRPKNTDTTEDGEIGAVYRPVVGYQLSQAVEIRSSDVDRVDAVSRQSTDLLSQGVPFESSAPQYLYTKLSDLKVTMQAEAARDARARAEQIARSSGCRIGTVRYAHMNAPVITPLYSTDISDNGVDDTTALDKRITAIVTMGFSIR